MKLIVCGNPPLSAGTFVTSTLEMLPLRITRLVLPEADRVHPILVPWARSMGIPVTTVALGTRTANAKSRIDPHTRCRLNLFREGEALVAFLHGNDAQTKLAVTAANRRGVGMYLIPVPPVEGAAADPAILDVPLLSVRTQAKVSAVQFLKMRETFMARYREDPGQALYGLTIQGGRPEILAVRHAIPDGTFYRIVRARENAPVAKPRNRRRVSPSLREGASRAGTRRGKSGRPTRSRS